MPPARRRKTAPAGACQASRWSLTIAHDPRGEVAELLQPDKMPTSYVVDRAGIVRYVNAGFLPADASTIEQHLLEVAGH